MPRSAECPGAARHTASESADDDVDTAARMLFLLVYLFVSIAFAGACKASLNSDSDRTCLFTEDLVLGIHVHFGVWKVSLSSA